MSIVFDILRGLPSDSGPPVLPVHVAQSKLVFDVSRFATGTLYLRSLSGSRTDGVVSLKHAPSPNSPTADWQDFATPITFTAAGFSRGIDVADLAYLALMPSVTETGGSWFVEASFVAKGDA